jgi:hypothetical protein
MSHRYCPRPPTPRTTWNREYAFSLEKALTAGGMSDMYEADLAHGMHHNGRQSFSMGFGTSCRSDADLMQDLATLLDRRRMCSSQEQRFYIFSLDPVKPSHVNRIMPRHSLAINSFIHCQLVLGDAPRQAVDRQDSHLSPFMNVISKPMAMSL